MVTPCLVHRANPTDTVGALSSCDSCRKGELGIGDVVMEPLNIVWGESMARVNNIMDNNLQPLTPAEGKW